MEYCSALKRKEILTYAIIWMNYGDMNCELPDVQAGFRKGKKTRDQIANICWIIEKAKEFQKIIYFCITAYAKAFDCVNHNKLWKNIQEMGYQIT